VKAELFLSAFLKTAAAFFSILFYTRISGKQQISRLTFYDCVISITFGSIAASIALDLGRRVWLMQQLQGLGCNDLRDISYASLDVNANLYVNERRD